MHTLLDPQNWLDLVHEPSFPMLISTLALGFSATLVVLYSDKITRWRNEQRERSKWMHWNH